MKNHWNCHVKKFLFEPSEKYDPTYVTRLERIIEQLDLKRQLGKNRPIALSTLGVSAAAQSAAVDRQGASKSASSAAENGRVSRNYDIFR